MRAYYKVSLTMTISSPVTMLPHVLCDTHNLRELNVLINIENEPSAKNR